MLIQHLFAYKTMKKNDTLGVLTMFPKKKRPMDQKKD